MTTTDPAAARAALLALMQAISEEHYCAGWLSDIEYALWHMIESGDHRFDALDAYRERVAELRALAETAGGWWIWRPRATPDGAPAGPAFVPMDEWRARYAAFQAAFPR